jgi:hypothetical protein
MAIKVTGVTVIDDNRDADVENLTATSVQLTGGTGDQGTITWNTDEKTLDVVLNGATLQMGQEVQYHVRNNTGSTIGDGVPVYATGTLGASGRITVAPYIANGTIPAKYFLGITTESIADGEDGKVTHFGKVRHLNTSAFTDGDVLYPSATTAGALTATMPTDSNVALPIGIVIHAASNGTLFVRATNHDENAYATAAQGALADSALQSYTETDPVYSASVAAGITSTNVLNWDTAYGWGDHSSAGYALTSSVPTDVSQLTDNTSILFSGSYTDLSNKPSFASVDDATALAIALG